MNRHIINYIFSSAVGLLLFFYVPVFAQPTTYSKEDPGLVLFDTLAQRIEKKYGVTFFYQPEWFTNKRFREEIANFPLDESLMVIKRLTELNCIAINRSNYVFVPPMVRNYSNRVNRKGVLIIGDEEETSNLSKVTLSGKIIDIQTGKPLKGARINIDKLNLSEATDKGGNYTITIPPGEYDLRLNYSGFEQNERTIRVSGNGIVDFELAEKSILLKEVVVRDKAADLNLIRTQMSTIKLNSKTLKELPSFLGERDIIKSMTLLPGVQSTGEFGTGFFVRGGSSDQNLILVEDVPLFNSSHLFGLNSVLNPDGVNNVSFLKAGIPAKYGERVSSVMDIRMGNNPNQFSGKGGIGILNTRLNVEAPLFDKKANLLIGGRTSYSDWLLHAMPDVNLKNSSAGFYDTNILFSMKFDPKNSMSVFGYFSDDKFSFTKSSPIHYDNTLVSLRYNHSFSDKLYSSLLLGYSRYRNDVSEFDSLQPKNSYIIQSSIDYNNLKLNFNWIPTDKHSVDIGIASVLYRLQPGKMSALGEASEVTQKIMQEEKALQLDAYISDNISFTPEISAEVGLRLTNYAFLGPYNEMVFKNDAAHSMDNISEIASYNNNQLIKWYPGIEPRLSMRYSLDDVSSLKFSYNKMSQNINLISNTAVMAPTDVYKLSNSNVEPLTCHQFALGYFHNYKDNAVETSVEVYFKQLNNILEYRDGASILLNNALETELLNASGYNYGIEFYIRKNTGRLTGWASYTYSRSMRHTSSTIVTDQINGNRYFPSSFDKPHNVVILGNYHLSRRWWISGTFTYNTGKPVTLPELKYLFNGKQYVYFSERNKYRLPDYHRLDVAITFDESLRLKQKWKGSWTLSILNLYSQKNPYSVFYKSSSQLESKYYQFFSLYNLFIIERPIPTLTYNFSF